MPFAKQSGFVAGLLQGLGESHHLWRQALPLHQGVADTDLKGKPPAHDRRTCWRAGRAHLKIREASRLLIDGIDMWGFQDRVPCAGEIPHALVIRQDKNDVGATSFKRLLLPKSRHAKKQYGHCTESYGPQHLSSFQCHHFTSLLLMFICLCFYLK